MFRWNSIPGMFLVLTVLAGSFAVYFASGTRAETRKVIGPKILTLDTPVSKILNLPVGHDLSINQIGSYYLIPVKGREYFCWSNVIPVVKGVAYGWAADFNEDSGNTQVMEELEVPGPSIWTRLPASTKIRDDNRVALTTRDLVANKKRFFNFNSWTITPGDSVGSGKFKLTFANGNKVDLKLEFVKLDTTEKDLDEKLYGSPNCFLNKE